MKVRGILRFHVWRCLGILCIGVAAFCIAVMDATYSWDSFFVYLFRDFPTLFYGYVLGIIGAAIFLSIEEDRLDETKH